MSGNKTDNGVLEVGTDEIRASYSEDTPGQKVEQFIKEREKSVHEAKDRTKKQFGAVFQNPLQGYPYNEAIKVTPIKEDFDTFVEGGSLAQKAAIAISKKEKAGKPGYDKEGKSLKNKKEELDETTDREIKAIQKLSKDMQSVLKGYQNATKLGDKELKDVKHNDTYKAILTARDKLLTLIGTLQTDKLLKGEEVEAVEELGEAKESVIDIARRVVDNKGAEKVKGVMLDTFTASAIVQVYDKVNDSNKKKMESMDLPKLAAAVWKILGKAK